MISLQLEQMSGDSVAIQLNRKPIATLFSWMTQAETFDGSQRVHDARHQLLDLWDRTDLLRPESAGLYLNALLSRTDVNGDRVTTLPGSERVVGVASTYLLRAFLGVGPKSNVVRDIHRRYIRVIPPKADFEGPFCHTMIPIHALLISSHERRPFEWMGYGPCAQEHASFTNTLVRVAYNRRQHSGKVPRWVLRFSLHSLSRDPPPPASVVADCLSIIAIDLGCDVSSVKSIALDERCVDT